MLNLLSGRGNNVKMKKIKDFIIDPPFGEKSEWTNSPYLIFLFIFYLIVCVLYGLFWVVRWILLSPIRPFTNSKWFCKQGFHKYRRQEGADYDYFKCIVCNKTKSINEYYG